MNECLLCRGKPSHFYKVIRSWGLAIEQYCFKHKYRADWVGVSNTRTKISYKEYVVLEVMES